VTDEQVNKIMETLGRLDERTELLVREIQGGEQPGIRQKIEDLQASRNRLWGGLSVLSLFGGLVEYFIHHKK